MDQWIVPTAAAERTELLVTLTRNRSCVAYLLITRALTKIGSPLIAPLAIKAFCSSKYVTKLGP